MVQIYHHPHPEMTNEKPKPNSARVRICAEFVGSIEIAGVSLALKDRVTINPLGGVPNGICFLTRISCH
jgi:hypothetical protein